MDITAILPPTNKAGLDLIKMLKEDNKQNEFKKVVKIIKSYTNVNQDLLEKQVTTQYVYDIIYKDFVVQIKLKIAEKYCSHVLNILHKKYVDFLSDMRNLMELCEDFNQNNNVENDFTNFAEI